MPDIDVMEPSDYSCPFCRAVAMVVNKRVRVVHVKNCPLRIYLAKRGIVPQRHLSLRKERLANV